MKLTVAELNAGNIGQYFEFDFSGEKEKETGRLKNVHKSGNGVLVRYTELSNDGFVEVDNVRCVSADTTVTRILTVGDLSSPDIGKIIAFSLGEEKHRGELRQLYISGEGAFGSVEISYIDDDGEFVGDVDTSANTPVEFPEES